MTIKENKLTLSQLEQYLSKAAWILKSPVDASDRIRTGRTQNFPEPEHVKKIFFWYKNYKDVENYVKVASTDDLKENDYNLNIPLYVEKIIEDNLPSVEEALTDLKEAWNNSLQAEEKFKKILKGFIE